MLPSMWRNSALRTVSELGPFSSYDKIDSRIRMAKIATFRGQVGRACSRNICEATQTKEQTRHIVQDLEVLDVSNVRQQLKILEMCSSGLKRFCAPVAYLDQYY